MTIDEAIEQEKFKARVDRIKSNKKIFHNNDEDEISACHRSAEEHERLAEWLEELKDYQDKNKIVVRVDCENMDSIKDKIDELSKYAENQYIKAIDDFIHECDKYCGFYSGKNKNLTREDMLNIAERLKGKMNNEFI